LLKEVLIIGTLTLVNVLAMAIRGRPITNIGESVLVPVFTLMASPGSSLAHRSRCGGRRP